MINAPRYKVARYQTNTEIGVECSCFTKSSTSRSTFIQRATHSANGIAIKRVQREARNNARSDPFFDFLIKGIVTEMIDLVKVRKNLEVLRRSL